VRLTVIAPILNEAQFIGYSIMALHPYVDEFVYAVSPKSDDGTIEILRHIAKNYGKVRLLFQSKYNFDPHDTKAYNEAFDDCIQQARDGAVWFCHPDMIATKFEPLQEGPLAWTTKITSYARNLSTVITKGRCTEWKNIHAKKFGLVYRGSYGSQNEDFYHSEITGNSLKHYGTDFKKYPYKVVTSGIEVNHYCENKPYQRRLEKMKLCLKTLHPGYADDFIDELASQHPRVTLEQSSNQFGTFEFTETEQPIPDVFTKYAEEFKQFQQTKEAVYG
jgi:glycosyltransferase involved in cell wall biosynthesis